MTHLVGNRALLLPSTFKVAQIFGKKCLFFELLVGDFFASIIGVHGCSKLEKTSARPIPFDLYFQISMTLCKGTGLPM